MVMVGEGGASIQHGFHRGREKRDIMVQTIYTVQDVETTRFQCIANCLSINRQFGVSSTHKCRVTWQYPPSSIQRSKIFYTIACSRPSIFEELPEGSSVRNVTYRIVLARGKWKQRKSSFRRQMNGSNTHISPSLKIDRVAGNPLKRYVEQTTRWGGRGLSDMSN